MASSPRSRRSSPRRSKRIAATAVAVLITAALAAGAEAASDSAVLERYRPLLVYDADERYFAQPVSLPPGEAEVRGGDRVYGHIATEDADTWLQYWLFYADNPQDRHPLGTGRHEGDWELIQLRLGEDGRPDLATLSQHSWAEGCAWSEFETQLANGVEVPRIYVANAAHSNYSRSGDYGRPFPDPTDEADGRGREVRPALTPISSDRPRWVAYPGRWGSTDAGFVPGEAPSPPGPRFQESGAWGAPTSYHQEFARPCGSGPPGRWWQTALGGAVILAAGVGTVILVRRRRRRR